MGETFLPASESKRSTEDMNALSRILGRFIGLTHNFFDLKPDSLKTISKLDLRPPTTVRVTRLGLLPKNNKLSHDQLLIPELSNPFDPDSLEITVPAKLVYP